MGSILVFELWHEPKTEERFVRIVFNGKVVCLEGREALVPLEEYFEALEELIPENFHEECAKVDDLQELTE